MDSATVMITWSDLPKELVERIGKCLNTYIDVLRIRSVCTAWRSSLPLYKSSPSLPLKLQVPIIPHDTDTYCRHPDFYLVESTVYLFQQLDDHGACVNATDPSSSRSGWLVKFMQTVDGKLRIVNPLCHKTINVSPEDLPNKVLNLLDFRVTQVCKSYHVQSFDFDPSRPCFQENHSVFGENHDADHLLSKVLLISTNHNFSLMAIHIRGELCYFKSGDEKWTTLRDRSCKAIHDIIVYKGNFYAVDLDSEMIKFDSSLNETKVASRLHNFGVGGIHVKKRLVESSGQLFLIDMFFNNFRFSCNNATEIKVYRLDEQKHEWTYVYTLGDRMFFAGDDCCFSVSSKDFGDQCRANCIYYTNGSEYMDILLENSDRRGGWSNQFGNHFSYQFCPTTFGFPPMSSNDDSKSGGLSEELVQKYEELNSHNTGVFTIEDRKLGSVDSSDRPFGLSRQFSNLFSPAVPFGFPPISSNDSSKSGGLSEELVQKYKGLHRHNTGVFTIEDGKLGSLLSFLDYADIFWPPPSWLNRQDRAIKQQVAES